ncbi:putative dehydrogenase [Opitutaceae bacterium TAV1]|nr:putative dehydrogenase [Opitutaceae bacterium TAV1]
MTTASKTWKIALLHDTRIKGLGGHLTHFAFRGLPGVETVALVDSNPDGIAERLRETEAARHYTTCEEMLDAETPDILVICSRIPGEHLAPIGAAARQGVHVFCEKPLTIDLREADRIVQLAEENRVRIAVAHLGRHALVFQAAKRMIESGAIGRPLTFYGRGKEDSRGGMEDMLVLGTHLLDLACFFFGPPESVFADISVNGRPLRREDRIATTEPLGPVAGDDVMAFYKFPDGVRGLFESRKNLASRGVRMGLTIEGSTGTLAVRYDEERKLRLSRSPFPPEDESRFDDVPLREERVIPGARPLDLDALAGHHRYFAENNRLAAWDLIRSIEENREPLAGARDARTVLEMIHGAWASQLTGRAVRLPLGDRRHPLE